MFKVKDQKAKPFSSIKVHPVPLAGVGLKQLIAVMK
jgi:hypothetical protein